MKKYTIIIAVFLIAASFCLPTQATDPTNNLSITIYISSSTYEQLTTWLQQYTNKINFTFIVNPEGGTSQWVLNNQTRYNYLLQYGECIPAQPYGLIRSTPTQRTNTAQQIINEWTTYTGNPPKGIFAYQPDTLTSNYLYTNGVEYVTGYCFDQYECDWMSERGGWQLPYYASNYSILAPENQTTQGITVLPYVTWDWIDSFYINHLFNTEPIGTPTTNSTQYITELIQANMNACQPFAYTAFSFDFDWLTTTGNLPTVTNIINWITTQPYNIQTCGDFTDWFQTTYQQTPTYQVNFTSPNSGNQIEWHYNTQTRIARTNTTIVSYINYNQQQPDKYLTTKATINFSQPHNGTNVIDNSLTYTIDALGGGQYRAPINTNTIQYTENLEDFSTFYQTVTVEPTPTIPEYNGTTLIIIFTALSIALIKINKIKKR